MTVGELSTTMSSYEFSQWVAYYLWEQEEQNKQNAETKKASGKQKLKDLGLDDDEIQALMGA